MKQDNSTFNNSQFTFHYEQGYADTLVMLKSIEKIPQLIYKQIYTTKYVWIDNDGTFFDVSLFNKIQQELGFEIVRFPSFEQFRKKIEKPFINNYYVLICQHYEEAEHDRVSKVTEQFKLRIIQVNYITKFAQKQRKYKRIFFHKDLLLDSLKKRNQKDSRQKFENSFLFITVQDERQSPEIGQSNVVAKSLRAVFKQQVGTKVQQELNQKLQELFLELQKVNQNFKNRSNKKQQQQFFEDLKEDLTNKQAIQWYTKQTVIFSTFNKLLRSMRHPAQIFYIQPFIKPLHRAISEKHKKQWFKNGKFTCYRGGHISEFEFKRLKKGEIIQNLNFMSTSLDRTVAQAFTINAYFIIHVEESEQQKQFNEGYGWIQAQSKKKGEHEVLFNPLNSFQVLGVKKANYWFQIELSYGPLAKAFINQRKTGKEISKLRGLAQHQKQKGQNIKIQGDALIDISENSIEKGAYIYWLKYEEIFNKIVEATEKQKEQIRLFKILNLFNKIGCVYRLSSNFRIAEKYYKQGIKLIQSNFAQAKNGNNLTGKDQQENAVIMHKAFWIIYENLLNNMGRLCQQKGELEKAEFFFLKCQKIQKQKLGVDNIEYTSTLNNLGHLYKSKGELQKALDYYMKSQKMQKQKLGEDSVSYAATLNNLAGLYQSKGELNKALSFYMKCQKIRKEKLGKENIEYALTLNNLGSLYRQKGQISKALMYYLNCENIIKQKLGEGNIDYALILNNLGALYQLKGDLDLALTSYMKCQKIQKQKLGEGNVAYLTTINNLGLLFQTKGELDKALRCYLKCQKINKQILGEDSLDYAISLNNLAGVYLSKRELGKALRYYLKCQKIKKQKLGQDSIQYATTLNNLGAVYKQKGELEKALIYFLKCQKIKKQKLGKNNMSYAIILF